MTKNKTALYVHWPFCSSRCSYCDFRAFPHQEKRIPAYAQALSEEIRLRKKTDGTDRLTSLYFGGGTPSHIPAAYLEAVMQTVTASFQIEAGAERTIEANPEDISPDFTARIHGLGFNRVSLGMQTFDSAIAAKIGRRHTKEDAVRAVRCLKENGIDNISVDLMTGLPGQTPDTVREDMQILATLPVTHLSVYALTLAPGTYLHRRHKENPTSFPDEAQERRMAHLAAREAEKAGLSRYEISNFSRPGKASRHNLTYWKLGSYTGVGLSAASYADGVHTKNTDSLRLYLERIAAGELPVEEEEILDTRALLLELLLTGLRLKEGVCLKEMYERTGIDLANEKQTVLRGWEARGMLQMRGSRIAVTGRGADLLDALLLDLMR